MFQDPFNPLHSAALLACPAAAAAVRRRQCRGRQCTGSRAAGNGSEAACCAGGWHVRHADGSGGCASRHWHGAMCPQPEGAPAGAP
eukprot:1147146-Pelagomonas_calceolata.AAC.8